MVSLVLYCFLFNNMVMVTRRSLYSLFGYWLCTRIFTIIRCRCTGSGLRLQADSCLLRVVNPDLVLDGVVDRTGAPVDRTPLFGVAPVQPPRRVNFNVAAGGASVESNYRPACHCGTLSPYYFKLDDVEGAPPTAALATTSDRSPLILGQHHHHHPATSDKCHAEVATNNQRPDQFQ